MVKYSVILCPIVFHLMPNAVLILSNSLLFFATVILSNYLYFYQIWSFWQFSTFFHIWCLFLRQRCILLNSLILSWQIHYYFLKFSVIILPNLALFQYLQLFSTLSLFTVLLQKLFFSEFSRCWVIYCFQQIVSFIAKVCFYFCHIQCYFCNHIKFVAHKMYCHYTQTTTVRWSEVKMQL